MKKARTYGKIQGWVASLLLLLCVACSTPNQKEVDLYNEKAYALHDRALDSVTIYAIKAYN